MPSDLEQEVRSLLGGGRKIEAVKFYKERTGCSLKDAKDAIEAIQVSDSEPEPKLADTELERKVLSLLEAGEKLDAVKHYRDQTGASLEESKLTVESIAARHGMLFERGWSSRVLIVTLVALVGVSVLVGFVMLKQ